MSISLAELQARAKAAVAKKELEAAAKKLETKARTGRQLTAEELELRERAEWQPVALVLVIDDWSCACGAEGLAPAGLMIHSEHTRLANTSRLVAPRFESQIPEALPRRYHYEKRITALCPVCCEKFGFRTKHAPSGPRPGPILGQFAGEGAGFVEEWQRLRGEVPNLENTDEEPSS